MSFFRSSRCAGLLFVALMAIPARLAAQSQAPDVSQAAVRTEARAQVVREDSLLRFRTRRVSRGRVDLETAVLRAEYRIASRVTDASDPVAAASAYLRGRYASYGLDPDLADLHVAQTRATSFNNHVVFQQMLNGVPVLRRQIKVNLDATRQPTMVVSSYAPHLRAFPRFSTNPQMPAASARTVAAEALKGTARTAAPELYVLPEAQPRLVWRVVVWPDAGGEWEVLVDASDGSLVALRNQATHNERGTKTGAAAAARDVEASSAANESTRGTLVDGSGLVFDPDPVTAAGTTYGGSYVDADDADSPALNDQRTEVSLRDITLGSDGLYRLEGPYVQIVGSGLGVRYDPPALPDPNGFRFTRGDERFEAVMAYYHVDADQRYVESLSAGTPPPRTVMVNPHGYTDDNSEYLPFQNAIIFGSGGIDDAEDGSVIRHEHAHAILNNAAPGLLSTAEGAAFHEGWADYWATSMIRGQIESGAVPPRDWTHVFPWDGNNATIRWCGRYLNHPGHYPDQTDVASPEGCAAYPAIYQKGLLWATTLMEVYDELGREVTDRLNLASHNYLNAPVTMADAAEALIQADLDLYDGMHTGTLIARLAARGFVDATEYGPIIAHDPLPNTEALGGSARLEVIATGTSAEVDSVMVYYGTTPVPVERLVLEPVSDGVYQGQLPLPSEADTLRYYIEAIDVLGRRSFLPADGAASAFSLIIGPDHTAPVLGHVPITRSSLAAWPATVVVEATDHIGVDSVWVSYELTDSTGAEVQAGQFGLARTLEPGMFQAPFPVPVTAISPNDEISYRIRARDASAAGNEAAVPATGAYTFRIIREGLLREYDFEAVDPAIVATGVWEAGEPTHGVQVAHSGSTVWGTNLDGSYPASPQRSTLDLPSLNLAALGETFLVFWHWYDFEHNGAAVPDSMKQIPLWDGGNVKVSVDGGATWSLAQPTTGYNGTIDDGLDNPLGGETAFGGYSFGWRRVVVPLPAAESVQIRFDFGTDLSNEDVSRSFAGWYIDDVSIVTALDADIAPPVASAQLEPQTLRGPGQAPPAVVVRAVDDVGVSRAEVLYEVYPAEGVPSEGRLRLAMSDTSLSYFLGSFPQMNQLVAGDRIDFRIRVRDYSGRETYLPDRAEPPLRVLYRNLEQVDMLAGAVPSGLWTRGDDTWRIEQGPLQPRSGLVLERIDLPQNVERITLSMRHHADLAAGAGANVKLTVDDGRTWTVIDPDEGYGATFDVTPSHPMAGEAIFGGSDGGERVSRFDLTAYMGQQVQVRLDFGLTRALTQGEHWEVTEASLVFATEDDRFEVERSLTLHPNFPDPFVGSTNVSYTIRFAAHVQIEVYDLLGRRIDVLVDDQREPGTHSMEYDGSRLAAGTYLLRMRVENTQRVERMVVVR